MHLPDPSTEKFVRLFAQVEHELYRYVLTLVSHAADADDVMQETAAALWRKFGEYDAGQPFMPWAVRFARIEVMRHRRKVADRRVQFSDRVVDALATERQENQALLEAQRRALTGCMGALSEKQRSLIAHRYGATDTIRRVAEESGKPVSTLYKTLHRVRRQLMECVTRRLRSEGWGV